MERSRRVYFLLLALAAVAGGAVGLWAAPILAFVVLECVWTVAGWARERAGSARERAGSPRERAGSARATR